jgi:starch phosphorylase
LHHHHHHAVDVRHLAQRLRDLAYNLWWTWNPHSQLIFQELSPYVWERSNHNAVAVLNEVSEAELQARLRDPDLSRILKHVVGEFDAYMNQKTTWASELIPHLTRPVAYFSAEFGLHESLPIYSGGLGVLSGDHIKSASDLGIPFVGIGLFYRHGYFQQRINQDGWQQDLYPSNDPAHLPVLLVQQDEGGRLLNSVEINHSTVYFQTWRVQVGRSLLYLLDTNIPENELYFQGITSHVYGGDRATRIGQEIVLGVGGVRLLRSLGIDAAVYHMNEGHSAFLALELLREELKGGKDRKAAERNVRSRCVFTTHTPVPAGHDRFSPDVMEQALGRFRESAGLSHDDLMSYGRINRDDSNEHFTMTVLALRMSRSANGVSELHGHVSRAMWKELYGVQEVEKVPIGHITNGVHAPGWATVRAHDFWNKRLGVDWTDKLVDPKFWAKLEEDGMASDEELWAFRAMLRRDLVEFIRTRTRERSQRLGDANPDAIDRLLSPDTLTVCFARRFATYKRAPLLFRHLDRIIPLLTDPHRPAQVIYAGKAHPRDEEGKKFIQRIVEVTHNPHLAGRVVFLEDYDINVARHMVSGADVWLNTPRRPLEASGTSGQKIAIHGGLNLSILDGWWREGYDGENGWAIGDESSEASAEAQDERDFEFLYTTLKDRVIPEFYDRDEHGIPRRWIRRIRHAMRTLIPLYNTDRMVVEYAVKYYAFGGGESVS